MALSDLFYFVDLYRNRARVRVRLLEEDFYSQEQPSLKFEAENLSTRTTSIEPVVQFHGFLPRPKGKRPIDGFKMVPYWLELMIDENSNRTLPPSTPTIFRVSNPLRTGLELSDKLGFMFFKTYTFAFTRGRKVKVRIRSADQVRLSWKRYVFERFHFALRGVNALPRNDEPFELDE